MFTLDFDPGMVEKVVWFATWCCCANGLVSVAQTYLSTVRPYLFFFPAQVCSVVPVSARLCLSWNWSTTSARPTEVTPSSPALASELVRVTISTTRWSPEALSFWTRRDQRSVDDQWMSVSAVAAVPNKFSWKEWSELFKCSTQPASRDRHCVAFSKQLKRCHWILPSTIFGIGLKALGNKPNRIVVFMSSFVRCWLNAMRHSSAYSLSLPLSLKFHYFLSLLCLSSVYL